MAGRTQPVANERGTQFRLPDYGRGVWRRWIVLTVLVFVPVGALTGLLFGDPANGEWDTALAWHSWWRVLLGVGLGVWIWVLPWTAIYFEKVNRRCRVETGSLGDGKAPGFALAITALVLGILQAGPVALAVDYVAWRRISSTRIRLARGAATAFVAAVAGTEGLIVWLVSPSAVF